MTSPLRPPMPLASSITPAPQGADPRFAMPRFPFRRLFYPLGFPLEIETNSHAILDAAEESWGEQSILPSPIAESPLTLRLGVSRSDATTCPPASIVRASGHLLTVVADQENFSVCDLERGSAFGWVNEATVYHRAYLRYHFLEATVMCMLTGSRCTPIHAACVGINGHGFLLCGESGAGKSTLAYACARAGFTLTADDACYVVGQGEATRVRGNPHQLRFRPSARGLFPELAHLPLTPRAEGKPSIEVRASQLSISVATEAVIHAVLFLHRDAETVPTIRPAPGERASRYMEAFVHPLEGVGDRQAASIRRITCAPAYDLHYSDLNVAVAHLKSLAGSLGVP